MKEIRTFDGYLNADDEANVLKGGEYCRAVNFRIGTTTAGAVSRLESVLGNFAITNPYLPGTGVNTTIGSVADEAGQYIVVFNYNTTAANNWLFLYYKPTGTWYKVVNEANLDGGLSFSKDSLITGAIVDGKLYWTDNLNEPRRINLFAAIKAQGHTPPISSDWQYTFPMPAEEMQVIVLPPTFPPTIAKDTDADYPSNAIYDKSFQFAYLYEYYDGERSVLSPYSVASNLNTKTDTYNFITVTLDATPPRSVRYVRLYAKYETQWFEIKHWDREQAAFSTFTFAFYNSIRGEFLDAAAAARPFHSVPNLAKAIAAARRRLFMGNLTLGYDAPLSTSLSLTPATLDGTDVTTALFDIYIYGVDTPGSMTPTYGYVGTYVYLSSASVPGFYSISGSESTTSGSLPPSAAGPYATLDFATNLTYVAATLPLVAATILPGAFTLFQYYEDPRGASTVISNVPQNLTGLFKSGAQYQAGLVFFDDFSRKCSVVTSQGLTFTTPLLDYNGTTNVISLSWALDNTSALTEIPEWATSYAVVITKCLTTRNFLQAYDEKVRYMKVVSGDNDYSDTTFGIATKAVAIDATALVQAGLGYTFAPGDMCTLAIDGGQTYQLPVIEQDGDRILLKAKDIGDLFTARIRYEIYTPYIAAEEEPFYEVGAFFRITDAGTADRKYGTLAGTIAGDVFLNQRNYNGTAYSAEAMSPNEDFYAPWRTSAGRINLISEIGRVVLKNGVCFSNTYVDGTKTNGLSEFDALNEEVLPEELGGIEKLVLTSKVEGEGNVLLTIGRTQVCSLYIGEAQITDSSGATAFFAKSTGVIGQVNVLKGDHGTQNPESVVLFNGNVYWIDVRRGCFVEYSVNGLDDISKGETGVFKFSRFSKEWCDKFLSLETSDFTALGSRPYIFGGVDVFHGEILFSLPKLSTTAPKGELSDYVTGTPSYVGSAMYPYDVLDYQQKTVVFKKDKARWMGEFSFCAEGMVSLGSDLYSFKNGVLYQHGGTADYNSFYGTAYKSKVLFPFNADNTIKEYQAPFVESSEAPEWTHFRSENPFEQSTDLVGGEWTLTEGVYRAALLRDRLSPNATGTYDQKLHTGEVMRNKAMLCLLQFNNTTTQVWLRLAGITYNNSTIQ